MQTYEVTDAANHNRGGVTAEGDILVSGQQGFAWVTADGTQRDPHTGTSTDAVNCAALDTEGNVWLASSNEGLICYSSGCFASPNLAAGLTDMDINAVTAAGGRYYAAVNQGLLAFDSDWHPVQNALTRALDGVPVQSLMVDSRGRLWCGTYSELGLVRYDTGSGEIVFFNQSNGLGSTRIRVAFELRDGMVAVGTQDGLALIRGDKVVAFYDKDSGLETQSILCIVQAPDGTLLAGSAGSGIYALAQDGSITKFSYEQGLEDGVVLRILQEEDGRSAFVSAGSHLYYWADGTFRRLDGLRIGPGSIFDLYERDGKLWLLQDSGIYALDKARILAGETPYATQYGTARGLTGSLRVNTCNYMAPDGSLYLATRNGISVFDFREISAPMLKELGVQYVIIGHSERRQYFGETDETVAKRVRAALESGLEVILCVGETLEQREADITGETIAIQVKKALAGVTAEELRHIIIAYEPVWAIGTGKTATDEQANEVNHMIRELLGRLYDEKTAEATTIQYGGSMNAKNCDGLLAQPDIDGGLIGGASLKAPDFAAIVEAASK